MSDPNSAHVNSTPAQPGQPYDATSTGDLGGWVTVDDHSGPADLTTGRATGEDWPSTGRWQQT